MSTVLEWGAEEIFGHALRGEECRLVTDGGTFTLPVEEWTRPANEGDRALVALCIGATIDLGCGPGRLTAELAARGHVALGIDIVGEAVGQTRRRGASALHRNLFAPVPGDGRWETALLADGNIGIGGDPVTLLRRANRLLAPGGRAVVEVAPPGVRSQRMAARLACACARSEEFMWAVLGADDVARVAQEAGFTVRDLVATFGRWAAILEEAP